MLGLLAGPGRVLTSICLHEGCVKDGLKSLCPHGQLGFGFGFVAPQDLSLRALLD